MRRIFYLIAGIGLLWINSSSLEAGPAYLNGITIEQPTGGIIQDVYTVIAKSSGTLVKFTAGTGCKFKVFDIEKLDIGYMYCNG